MSFEQPSSKQFAREARIGLTVVAILLMLFVYVAAKRMTGGFDNNEPTKFLGTDQLAQAKPADSRPLAKKHSSIPAMPNTKRSSANRRKAKRPNVGDSSFHSTQQSLEFEPSPKTPNILDSQSQNTDPGPHPPSNQDQFPPIVVESGINVLDSKNSTIQEHPTVREQPFGKPQTSTPSPLPPRPSDRSRFSKMKAPGENSDLTSPPIKLAGGTEPLKKKPSQFEPGLPKPSLPKTTELPPPLDPTPSEKSPPALPNSLVQNDLRAPATKKAPRSEMPKPPTGQFNGDIDLPPPNFKTRSSDLLPLPSSLKSTPTQPDSKTSPANVSKLDSNSTSATPKSATPSGFDRAKLSRPPFEHVATAKDSYWSLAQKAYGSGQWFRALHRHNQKLGNGEISPGTKVDIPTTEFLRSAFPKLAPDEESKRRGKTQKIKVSEKAYVTSKGETLFSIAAEQLGQASRYVQIIELNRNVLPQGVTHLTRLKPGTRILLPVR